METFMIPAMNFTFGVVSKGEPKTVEFQFQIGDFTATAFREPGYEWDEIVAVSKIGEEPAYGGYGWSNPAYTVGLNPKNRLLLLTQSIDNKAETYALRLDVSKMPSSSPPLWTEPPPIRPQVIPPDDPKWLASLKSLPANQWFEAKTQRQPEGRGWGIALSDPVLGHVYYFGGGHATYQVNDVAIYVVGANRWVYAVGEHNDWTPPVGWGGIAMGFLGGSTRIPPAKQLCRL